MTPAVTPIAQIQNGLPAGAKFVRIGLAGENDYEFVGGQILKQKLGKPLLREEPSKFVYYGQEALKAGWVPLLVLGGLRRKRRFSYMLAFWLSTFT